jgi:shikimate kinase
MIWLVGMMGAGKSAVGEAVAATTGLRHVDTDAEIERRADASINRLFETVGEPTFRLFEAAVVAELAADGGEVVVSTGGGVILDPASVERMRASGDVVWLTAGSGDLADRVGAGEGRPLLADDDVEGSLGDLLARRAPLYEAAAHHRVTTTGREPADIAAQVIELCRPL